MARFQWSSQPELRKTRVVIRPPPKGPAVFPIVFSNREIVDAGDAASHQAVFIELPVLVAIGTKPIARVVMPFVGKTDRNAIALKCPKFFDEAIVQLLAPFAGEECNDCFTAVEELRAVAPHAVRGVGEG